MVLIVMATDMILKIGGVWVRRVARAHLHKTSGLRRVGGQHSKKYKNINRVYSLVFKSDCYIAHVIQRILIETEFGICNMSPDFSFIILSEDFSTRYILGGSESTRQ